MMWEKGGKMGDAGEGKGGGRKKRKTVWKKMCPEIVGLNIQNIHMSISRV